MGNLAFYLCRTNSLILLMVNFRLENVFYSISLHYQNIIFTLNSCISCKWSIFIFKYKNIYWGYCFVYKEQNCFEKENLNIYLWKKSPTNIWSFYKRFIKPYEQQLAIKALFICFLCVFFFFFVHILSLCHGSWIPYILVVH